MDVVRAGSVWKGIVVLLVIAAGGLYVAPVHGQDPIRVTNDRVSVRYPSAINFVLNAIADNEITDARLFWQAGPASAFTVQVMSFQPSSRVALQYPLSTRFLSLPPFARITYRWLLRDSAGNELTTENRTFEYADTQRPWQEMANERIRLLWYDLDPDLATSLFSIADQAYLRMQDAFGVELSRQPMILIYSDQAHFAAFQSMMNNLEYVVGRYFPGHNITVNLVTPEMPPELYQDTIAHELSHLYSDNFYVGYARLPLWLEEGLATFNETQDGVEELREVRRAAARDRLVALIDLPGAIRSRNIATVNLAYAEGATIFQYIQDTWGQEGLVRFLNAFRRTTSFSDVVQMQFGLTMAEFEMAWRAWLGYPVDHVPELMPTPTMVPFFFPTPTFMAPGA